MSEDSFSEITHQGWLSRIGDSIKGVLVGLVLVGIGCLLLFWNEGRTIKNQKGLEEGAGAVVSVKSDAVLPENDNKLIHFSAVATTSQHLEDKEFGISPKDNVLKLRRTVQMYQWKEDKESKKTKKLGGGETTETIYNYSKTWSSDLISSSSFKHAAEHQNPASMAYPSIPQEANPIKAGAFTLSKELVAKISNFEAFPVAEATTQPVTDTALAGPERATAAAPATPPVAAASKFKISNGGYYIGADPANPQIGDLKVSFAIAKSGPVSVVAKQVTGELTSYAPKTGAAILDLRIGTMAAKEMFAQMQAENRMMGWILRLVGFLAIWFGLMAILKPFVVLADVIPFLGDLLGAGLAIASLLVATVISLVVISIGWLFYRPVLGVVLLAAAVGGLVLLKSMGKAKKLASVAAR